MIFMDDLLHTGLARHTADVTGLDPATVKRRAISFPVREIQVLSFLRLR
jgi:hypothetical protein